MRKREGNGASEMKTPFLRQSCCIVYTWLVFTCIVLWRVFAYILSVQIFIWIWVCSVRIARRQANRAQLISTSNRQKWIVKKCESALSILGKGTYDFHFYGIQNDTLLTFKSAKQSKAKGIEVDGKVAHRERVREGETQKNKSRGTTLKFDVTSLLYAHISFRNWKWWEWEIWW